MRALAEMRAGLLVEEETEVSGSGHEETTP